MKKETLTKSVFIKLCFLVFIFLLKMFLAEKAFAATNTEIEKKDLFSFPVVFEDKTESAINLPFDEIQTIASVDLGGDGTSEFMITSPNEFLGEIFLARQDGSIINSWYPYGENFYGGVEATASDIDKDGAIEIITAPHSGGGPHIRIFDGFGNPKITQGFFADDQKWRGEIKIFVKKFFENEPIMIGVYLKNEKENKFKIFSLEGKLIQEYPTKKDDNQQDQELKEFSIKTSRNSKEIQAKIPKKIKTYDTEGKLITINIAKQKLSYYQDGYRIKTYSTSTGAPGYGTPKGEFSIINKTKLAYSKTYGLYMPFWMAFTKKGHGIHELPYWPSGYREGEDHLGKPVSHGCVRLGIGSAGELFEWAEVGTKIKIFD